MSKTKIVIVDENDKIIGHKERGTLDQSDIYRVSALWIQNSKKEILLAQRSINKKNNPGQWGPAVAGTIDEGESYESNIIQGAKDEIGLENQNFEKALFHFHDGEHRHFTQWFYALIDKEIDRFVIKKTEIERIKWFTQEELKSELKNNPDKFLEVIPDCIIFFNKQQ